MCAPMPSACARSCYRLRTQVGWCAFAVSLGVFDKLVTPDEAGGWIRQLLSVRNGQNSLDGGAELL